ncbi:MAG TPA: MBL fold metallo-hydrolase, partial [Candidatus Limnocylindrales bacterium]|nr:MBL fold metallo-hydrolase [Candidatus Limnocylindrales bacterium]
MSAPTALRLVPLGTGGYFPSAGRQTMAFLLVWPGGALLLDAGTGVARLAEPGIGRLLEGVGRLDVLLTHYHLDHVAGLSYLPGILRETELRIFAPTPPLTTHGSEALDRLISPPLFPVGFHRWPMPVEVVPYAGSDLRIGPLEVRVRAQKHPGGSVGVRIGDALAYITDTILDLSTIPFVHGVRNLLHEVWLDDDEAAREDAGRAGHSAAGPVAELATTAQVGRLLPIHHHPRRTAEALEALVSSMRRRAG